MKIKLTTLALCACSIAILPAQTIVGETIKIKQSEGQLKAETPVEKQAFKMFNAIASFPEILEEIQDATSLEAAEVKLEKLLKDFKKEEAALLKLKVPDNAAREKLTAKMKPKIDGFLEKILSVRLGKMSLPKETASKLGLMVTKFEEAIKERKTTIRYFTPDQEKKEK